MPKKACSHHVVPNSDGGWDVKKDGAIRSSGYFDKKQDAVDAGHEIGQNQGTEFFIHEKTFFTIFKLEEKISSIIGIQKVMVSFRSRRLFCLIY